MKLLYIYFDFTQNGTNQEGYRGHKTCELNFCTQAIYHMRPPIQDRPFYVLTREERSECEKIVSGFWGDERIYNVSALVGDNGSGKSMLIHEIIRCLMTSFHEHVTFEKLEEPQYPFVFVTESVNGELYVVNFHIDPEVCGFPETWKRISLPIGQHNEMSKALNWGLYTRKLRKEYGVLRQSKLIYFSNAITMADKTQYDYWNYYEVSSKGYSTNSLFFSPVYDCSLVADMSEAIKISKADNNTIDNHFDTYFNFRSYQEARYVFDRNQRKILLDMRDKHRLPVPLPKLLKLTVLNAFQHNSCPDPVHRNAFFNFFNNDYFKSHAFRFVASLSMNCILAFCASEKIAFIDEISCEYLQESECLEEDNLFQRFLSYTKDKYKIKPSEYFRICERYLRFLWENISLIDRYFIFKSTDLYDRNGITVEIPLGEIIDNKLEEFMIQFINFTRAVSKYHYFVIYNWGLSSGESNLLHMFTKLRYALTGNIFDKEQFCEYGTKKPDEYIKREEKLVTTTDNKTTHDCDSVILFIDEADLTYHPEWQRQFISIITEFLPKIYTDPYYANSGSGCKEIQVILSTHSPLILGDFPSSSVIYLRKNKNGINQIDTERQRVTFGENLYTILKDSFYLKDGTVGEFARRKIKQVLDETSSIREEATKEKGFQGWTDEDFIQKVDSLDALRKKTVQYLSHGIIRSKLEEEINICYRILHRANNKDIPQVVQDIDYQARIRQLEREKTILEERINALNQKAEAAE